MSSIFGENYLRSYGTNYWQKIPIDFKNYFSESTLITLVIGFSAGAVMANTTIDQDIQDFYQNNLRSQGTDNFFQFWKYMGQDQALYAYGGLSAFALTFQNRPMGGYVGDLVLKSARAFIVGTIPLHVAREIVGGSRPSNTTRSSTWDFFTLPHGVSGHTYTGAILFITGAKMVDDLFLKSLLYIGSTLTGISRINDNDHYPSQVMLGWLMAYVACEAVSRTDSNYYLSITPEKVSFKLEF
ncbi:MAG: hypothetical protein S4CHLAM20_12820 [Chlamydiia bacterium]|nr:hypothetical protein [Chlamydiia bacterium]